MPSTAGPISREMSGFAPATFARAGSALLHPMRRADAGRVIGEDLTQRAIASAGLAALIVLPVLLLSSLALGSPLAVPAVIGLGYLAVSQALAAENRRRAAIINAAVLSALVGWLLVYLLLSEGRFSYAGLLAALMAPLFAAAPACARSLISAWTERESDPLISLRDAALDRVACLDELTPAEEVLVLDRSGSVLAATSAARRKLRLFPDAIEHHLRAIFDADQVPGLFEAIDNCGEHGVPGAAIDLFADPRRQASREKSCARTATFSRCADGTIAMRLQDRAPLPADVVAIKPRLAKTAHPAKRHPSPCSFDIAEALAFALRHAEAKAAAKKVLVTSSVDAGVAAACDRQVGRRILRHLLEVAVTGSRVGGTLHVLARRLKGVVLLRVSCDSVEESADAEADATRLRLLVEASGGTLVVSRERDGLILSVRLDLATSRGMEKQVSARAN